MVHMMTVLDQAMHPVVQWSSQQKADPKRAKECLVHGDSRVHDVAEYPMRPANCLTMAVVVEEEGEEVRSLSFLAFPRAPN